MSELGCNFTQQEKARSEVYTALVTIKRLNDYHSCFPSRIGYVAERKASSLNSIPLQSENDCSVSCTFHGLGLWPVTDHN